MSNQQKGLMTPEQYRAAIRREADQLLAALTSGDETARVPSCPDWTVRDLVDHTGEVHLWAAANAQTPPSDGPVVRDRPGAGDADLATWYGETVDNLLRTLDATDPDQPCWTFQPANRTVWFWFRRQAQELAMHRADVEAALGGKFRYEPELASDGIDEVLDVFLHRRRAYGVPSLPLTVPLLVECTDRPERWLVEPVPGTDSADHHAHGPALSDELASTAAGTLRGTAAGLLFTFWKRQDVDSAGLALDGDTEVAREFAEQKLTP